MAYPDDPNVRLNFLPPAPDPQQQPQAQGGPLNQAFSNLRMQNMFPPQNPIEQGPQTFGAAVQGVPMMPQAPQVRLHSVSDYYTPENRASDMMYALLNQIPQRNTPGLGRKILASIGGAAGGPQLADQMMYAPYYQQMQDWNAHFGPVEKAASEERMSNANLRALAYNMAQDQDYQERLRIQQQGEERKYNYGQQKIEDERRKISLDEWRARNQNKKTYFDSKGRLIGVDPLTNKGEFVIGPDGQPITSNQLTYEQRMNLATAPRTTNVSTNTSTTVTGPTPETPQEEKVRKHQRALDLFNKYPEMKPYIHMEVPEPNTYTITTPSSSGLFGYGKDPEYDKHQWQLWNTINRYIETGELDPDTKLSTDRISDVVPNTGKTTTSKSQRNSTTSRTLPKVDTNPNPPNGPMSINLNYNPSTKPSQYVPEQAAAANALHVVESEQGKQRRAANAAKADLERRRQIAIQKLKDAGEDTDELNIQHLLPAIK